MARWPSDAPGVAGEQLGRCATAPPQSRRGERLTVVVADDEAGVGLLDGPGRREAAGHAGQIARNSPRARTHSPARRARARHGPIEETTWLANHLCGSRAAASRHAKARRAGAVVRSIINASNDDDTVFLEPAAASRTKAKTIPRCIRSL
jgi:hypothetical protein